MEHFTVVYNAHVVGNFYNATCKCFIADNLEALKKYCYDRNIDYQYIFPDFIVPIDKEQAVYLLKNIVVVK
jgi:hypothetical protein